MKNILIYLSLPLMLIACGGSSTTNPIDNSAPTPLINNAIIAIDDNLSNQQAVELILFYPNKKISNINWQQLSGPMVNFLTPTSKVIAFTPQESGEYQFKVSFLVNGSAQQTLSKSINVANDNSLISARLGQSALEGNKVSLRAWLDPSLEPSSVTWQQISGPSVLLKDYKKGDLAIFFTAPAIEQDTLVEFKVKASNSNNTYTDTVAILIENTNNIINYAYFNQRIAKVFPYHSNSPYGNNLVTLRN